MADQLITVDSDAGPVEPTPVTIVAGGSAIDFGQTNGTRLTSRVVISAASVNATLVKNSPGYAYAVMGYNVNAAARYLKLYNKATQPTVGTDVPIMTLYLPSNSDFYFDLAAVRFTAGIGMAITTAATDADASAIAAGDIMALNMVYA